MITSKRVPALLGNSKGHFVPIQRHLQVVLLRFVALGTESLKHMHNFSPMNVVRSWMRKELLHRLLGVVAHGVTPSLQAYPMEHGRHTLFLPCGPFS